MQFGVRVPFVESLGLALERSEGGESTLTYVPQPAHLNSFGVAHGGAVMTLLDVTMAVAARSLQPDQGVVTVEMKTSFLRPAPGEGGTLTGHGRVLHRTRRLAFTEARLLDAQGQLCAHATGTFRYTPRPAEGQALPTD